MSESRAGGLDLEQIAARNRPTVADGFVVAPANPDVSALIAEVRALRTALRPFSSRAQWTIASTPGERLHEVTDDDVLPVPRLACRRAAEVLGAPRGEQDPE